MRISIKLVLAFSVAFSSFGATRYVRNGPATSDCPRTFTTIQAGVDGSVVNDTLIVCVGTGPYNEQVTINKNMIIAGQPGATIRPSPMVATTSTLAAGRAIGAAILVTNANVTIFDLILDGAGNNITGCTPDFVGIYYKASAGIAAYNAIRNFRLGTGLEGCQTGDGIYIESVAGQPSNVTAFANSISRFQKNGITANGPATSLTAGDNVVIGIGPTPNIAQNGIQIGFGATGAISGNTVADMVYTPCVSVANCPASSTGILVFDPGAAITSFSNTVVTTQTGIYYYGVNNGTISYNKISNTLVYDGIAVTPGTTATGNGNTVENNTVTNSGESAVYVSSSNNRVRNSNFNEAPVGVLFDAGTGNTQTGNNFYNIPVTVQNTPPTTAARVGLSQGPKVSVKP